MQLTDDNALLRQYVENQSDEAFGALVTRHVNLVYSVALRQLGQPHQAEEVTQAVFIILAKKAARIRHEQALTSWLFQTTRLTANSFIRGEMRRRHREQEAYMRSVVEEPAHAPWPEIAPLLDDAVGRLGEKDRRAILLRFYEGRNLREIGPLLGVSEAAAEKRVSRALEKLRRFFVRRGVHSTTAIVSESISANSVQAAPMALAKTVTAIALAKGASTSISTLTLVKGALKIMAWTKAKTAIVGGVAAILVLSMTTVVVKMSFFPVIKDAYFEPNYRHFQNVPTGLFVLRPTRFRTPANGLDYSAEGSSPTGEHVTRVMGRNRSFAQLLARLYNCGEFQMVFPADVPKEHFDYLFTILDNSARERFEAAIKNKLGYVASWQNRDTDVFLLKVQSPNSPGLKSGNPSRRSFVRQDANGQLMFQNWSVRDFSYHLENLANVPIMDETGLAGRFDFDLNCTPDDVTNRDWDTVNQALGKLGLELVTTNMPLQMLVVEKAK